MIISYTTLLPVDIQHAVAVDIDIAIKPISVRLIVKELDVAAIITIVSNEFSSVVIVLYFLNFFDLMFLSLKYVMISLMLLIWLLKLLTLFSFFSSRCSKSIISNGADGYNRSFFVPFI